MTHRFAPLAGLALAALAPALLHAQGSFEGVVTYRATMAGAPASEMKYYQKGVKLRQEATMGGRSSVSIMNGATGETIVLMPEMKQYMVMNLNEMAKQMPMAPQRAPDLSQMKVTATGRRETIAGVPCEHYLFSDAATPGAGTSDVCGAAGMGFMGAGNKGMGAFPSTAGFARATHPQRAALARRGFFPLKMTVTGPDGSAMTWQVVRIERRSLEAALFAPPAGYAKMAMPAMPGMPPRR